MFGVKIKIEYLYRFATISGCCSSSLLNEETKVHHRRFAPASVSGVTVFTGKPSVDPS
ncbi:hypothetical protein HanXRQr2_Chr04g0145551 [Helianthus annuus]|uniref:Uncharacterized protein n=1 Tax=Helianthus annuus TaxID=4232 RepID=A0A9K3J541_HELAN|nr:hypothetical protein HanXRQr2_Chr04g0145551 [Helianthus annuus]